MKNTLTIATQLLNKRIENLQKKIEKIKERLEAKKKILGDKHFTSFKKQLSEADKSLQLSQIKYSNILSVAFSLTLGDLELRILGISRSIEKQLNPLNPFHQKLDQQKAQEERLRKKAKSLKGRSVSFGNHEMRSGNNTSTNIRSLLFAFDQQLPFLKKQISSLPSIPQTVADDTNGVGNNKTQLHETSAANFVNSNPSLKKTNRKKKKGSHTTK